MASNITGEDFLVIIVAILLPPVAVLMMKKPTQDVLINLVLTLLGFWIAGTVHALYLLYQKKQSSWL